MAGVNEKIGYDELLFDRVKQLKEIEERLTDIVRLSLRSPSKALSKVADLQNDVLRMVREAEEEHAAF